MGNLVQVNRVRRIDGRGGDEDCFFDAFMETAYDELKAVYDNATAEEKEQMEAPLKEISQEFNDEFWSDKNSANMAKIDIDEEQLEQVIAVIKEFIKCE